MTLESSTAIESSPIEVPQFCLRQFWSIQLQAARLSHGLHSLFKTPKR
jgi:hypothetical protein